MSCFIHNKKQDVAKCNVCKKTLCEDCKQVQEHFGACPKCSKSRLEKTEQKYKNGLKFNIASVVCFVLFVVVFALNIFYDNATTSFVIIGAIVSVLLGGLSIFLLVRTTSKIKKLKKLINETNLVE